MEKTYELFDSWNLEKKKIEFHWKLKRVKVGEIWICKIWVNIWWEISKDGRFSRPVLVVSNKLWWDLVAVIPFTTILNENLKQYLFELDDFSRYWLQRKSYLVLNQLKIISLKRLERKLNGYYRKSSFLPIIPHNKVNYYVNQCVSIIKKNP